MNNRKLGFFARLRHELAVVRVSPRLELSDPGRAAAIKLVTALFFTFYPERKDQAIREAATRHLR